MGVKPCYVAIRCGGSDVNVYTGLYFWVISCDYSTNMCGGYELMRKLSTSLVLVLAFISGALSYWTCYMLFN